MCGVVDGRFEYVQLMGLYEYVQKPFGEKSENTFLVRIAAFDRVDILLQDALYVK